MNRRTGKSKSPYANRWEDFYNGDKATSETLPIGYAAQVAMSRVHGEKYTPYDETSGGSAEWIRHANHRLADAARSNYERLK